jgi:PAS domain S-box-containing protein
MAINILLVDDDEDALNIASTYLRRDDPTFEIATSGSAEEAMSILKEREFDVVVSDYEMPNGKSGLEFLEVVKAQSPDMPFIIFTGRGREEVAIRALNLGADSYVTKGGDAKIVYAELAHTIRSVVAHRRAKLALEESDARLRAAFEDAAIGMAIISIDQEIIQVNNTLCEMLGFRADELVGRNLEEIAHPDEIGQAPLKALRILDGEKDVLSGERRFLHRDGKWVWTRTTSSLTRDSKGNPLYFVSQFQDITETKKAVEALKDSEMRFRGAFDDAAIGMALIDFNSKILDCNQALCQMLGYTKDEITTMTFAEFTHPDDLDKVPRIIDGKFENGKSAVQLEKRYLHKSGHTVYTFVSSSIEYNEYGDPIYFISQFQDVTEQRLARDALATSEANYRNLVENSLQNYAIIQDGRYVYVNQPFANTLGLARDEILSLTAEEVWKHVHPDDVGLLRQRDGQLQETAQAIPKSEFRYIRPNGEVRWVEGFIQPTEYDGRPATQIVEIDITERKSADDALRSNQEILSRQKEELSDFAAVMSHDLRQSLHNALLFAELLQDEYSQEHISGIMDMITSAQEILKKSLALAEAGRVIGEVEEVDLGKLVDEVANREVNEPTAVCHDTLPVILCDRLKMAQILSNLFRNAVEHGEAKHIEIETRREKNQLELLVTNDGHPIPEKLREKVFKAQASSVEGRGLGLMIVSKLVDAHGWKICLDPSEKTTFRITIPQKS